MKLRSYLFALTLASLLPVTLFAAILGAFLIEQERETFQRGAQDRALALVTAVDAELKGSIDTLRALAQVRSLNGADLAFFRESAAQVLASQSDWLNLNLALPDGRQVVNLRIPPGTPLPNLPESGESLALLAAGRKPVVGDMVVGPATQRWDFAVRVPVVRDGQLRYVLSAVVNPESIQRLIASQGLPGHWEGTVLDRSGRIVARTIAPERSLGQLASQDLRRALAHSGQGWFRGTTQEGQDAYQLYRRSEQSGWTFAMSIPPSAVDGAATRAIGLFLLALFAALGLAFACALFVGRRISRPIAALVTAADAIAQGGRAPAAAEVADIEELRALERALADADRAQEALRLAEERLRAADRHKDEFIAMLSHELRNPLAALTTAAHVLRVGNPGDANSAGATAVIERQTRQMCRLVDDLLDITRVKMGKVSLGREPVDLGRIATEVLQSWRQAGRLAGRASVHLDAAAAWVHGDRVRIEQIVANLLDNALKFTPPDGAIDVTVRNEGAVAVLRVRDGGIGIAPQSLPHVFEPFVQGELATGRGGLGLGLALVSRLAELHGGSAHAESEGVGQGSTFTVRLPVSAPAVEPPLAPAGVVARHVPRRILLVEDNEDERGMLGEALVHAGHQVREAADGAGAIAAAAEGGWEVAVIDIGLPDMDGYEVARRLRAGEAGAEMTLIALSGFGPKREAVPAQGIFRLHLVKPVDPKRLCQLIADLTSAAPADFV